MKFFILFLIPKLLLAVETKEILTELMGIHGPNWHGLIKNDDDKTIIANTLKSLIEKSIDPTNYGIEQSFSSEVRQRAIGEYGRFVSPNKSGTLSSEVKDFYQELLENKEEQLDYLATTESLKNIASFEAIDLLSDDLKNEQKLSMISTLTKLIKSSLSAESQELAAGLDHSYIARYSPNQEVDYTKRPGNWEKTLTNLQEALIAAQKKVLAKSRDPRFINNYQTLSSELQAKKSKKIVLEQIKKENLPDRKIAEVEKKIEEQAPLASKIPEEETVPIFSFLVYLKNFFLILGTIFLFRFIRNKFK